MEVFVGLDVHKATISVAIAGEERGFGGFVVIHSSLS